MHPNLEMPATPTASLMVALDETVKPLRFPSDTMHPLFFIFPNAYPKKPPYSMHCLISYSFLSHGFQEYTWESSEDLPIFIPQNWFHITLIRFLVASLRIIHATSPFSRRNGVWGNPSLGYLPLYLSHQ